MALSTYLRKLVHHSFIYGLADFLGKAMGLVLIPLYTRTITPEEMGQRDVLLVFQTFGVMVMGLGQVGTMLRYYDPKGSPEDRGRLIGGTALVSLLSCLVLSIPILFLSPSFADRFLGDRGLSDLVMVVLLTIVFRLGTDLPLAVLRVQERSHLYGLANILRLGLSLGLILYFLLGRGWGLHGVFLGELVGNGAVFLVLLGPYLSRMKSGWSRSELFEWIRFGWPLVGANLGAFALISIDKLFLAASGLITVVAVYSLGGKVATLIHVVILGPFTLVWGPMMYRIHRENPEAEAKRLYAAILTYYALLLYWAGLFLVIFSAEILAIAGPAEYSRGILVVPFLVTCAILYGLYRHIAVGLNITGQTRHLAVAFLVAGLVNLVGNALLVPRYEMMGAAVATLIAYITMLASVASQSRRFYPIPYEWGRLTIGFVLAAALAAPTPWLNLLGLGTGIAVKTLIVLTFPAIIWFGGYLRGPERARAMAMLRDFRRSR